MLITLLLVEWCFKRHLNSRIFCLVFRFSFCHFTLRIWIKEYFIQYSGCWKKQGNFFEIALCCVHRLSTCCHERRKNVLAMSHGTLVAAVLILPLAANDGKVLATLSNALIFGHIFWPHNFLTWQRGNCGTLKHLLCFFADWRTSWCCCCCCGRCWCCCRGRCSHLATQVDNFDWFWGLKHKVKIIDY